MATSQLAVAEDEWSRVTCWCTVDLLFSKRMEFHDSFAFDVELSLIQCAAQVFGAGISRFQACYGMGCKAYCTGEPARYL